MFLETVKKEKHLGQLIVVALFTAVFAGAWDVWWHGFLGRESFWSPPHLLLYSAAIVAIFGGIYGWRKYRNRVWKWLGIVLLLVPISAPFDELWHRIFGVEEISSVLILWSPPHIILILAITVAFILLLPIIKGSEDVTSVRVFTALNLAGLFSLFSILTNPLEPIGPWHLLGFWGVGILTFSLILILFFARQWLPGIGSTIAVSFPIIVIAAIGFAEPITTGTSGVAPHAHAPGWLIILSLLLPALFLDLKKSTGVFSAALAGLISGGVLYGFATLFIDPAFQYGVTEVVTVLIVSFFGGLIAGILVKSVLKTKLFGSVENYT
ncbi:MAG: hypothetical protein KJI72_00305 [Patescibacteria group bacterium]|nr:hypothetical protein [Patescibacteria group bacterium]